MRLAVLVVAAGRGSRFGGEIPKQYASLAGRPVLRHALDLLSAVPGVVAVRCVVHPDDAESYRAATKGLDLMPPVAGGRERQDSVRAGLESLADAAPDAVLIHDGARPFPSGAMVARLVEALRDADAALPCLPVSDTLQRVEAGQIAGTVAREGLARAQTPQAFRFPAILEAHRRARETFTDDAGLARAAGLSVVAVAGEEDNLKITVPEDIDRAERILAARMLPRVGTGFDVHAFGEGDHVVLCGVAIPHERGLSGHSDADVGLHALTDALLGAIAAGDIGSHFPPSDPQWRGADSALFLTHAADLVRARGGLIVHVDVTLICERPKIGPHREAMTARIGGLLELSPNAVSVKATTTERLGFAGRGEGIAAQAAATVMLPA